MERLGSELEVAREQQAATSEILHLISRMDPGSKAEPVLEAIVATAARLCGAEYALAHLLKNGRYHTVASNNANAALVKYAVEHPMPPGRGSLTSRTALEGRTIHVDDCLADPEYTFPEFQRIGGFRTMLGVPLVRDGTVIGVLGLLKSVVAPFTDAQIALVTTFADQAVIALQNVRLFEAEQARTRELSESLRQQTATADVLKTISRSTFDLQTVLDTLVESATRLCDADHAWLFLRDGDFLRWRSSFGHGTEVHQKIEEFFKPLEVPMDRGSVTGRAALEARVVHVPDVLTDREYTWGEAQAIGGYRAALGVPLLRDGLVTGVIFVAKVVPEPYTEKQIELVTTFADQAVIAINNVALFHEVQARTAELSEALEQQTATSDVLNVISRSAFDLPTVLETLTESAARLCEADMAGIARQRDGTDEYYHETSYNAPPEFREYTKRTPVCRDRGSVVGRALLEGVPVQVPDVLDDAEYSYRDGQTLGRYRTILGVPLLREGNPIGVIFLARSTVRPFTNKQTELVQTFADQAVIAIENVRLFEEVQARTEELTEALQQQTATADVLKVISRSTFELQPVLDTLLGSAARLCEAERAFLFRFDGTVLRGAARYNASPELWDYVLQNPISPGRHSGAARAALERQTVHVPDVLADPEYSYGAKQVDPIRTILGVPMLKGDELIGVFMIYRLEVRPFTEKQIELVTTFADQAVIAIENVRLFEEVQARTAELTEALEYQTATSEVLNVISRSTTDAQPVFDAIVESASRLCDAAFSVVWRYDGDLLHYAASHNFTPEVLDQILKAYPKPPDRSVAAGRAVLDHQLAHIPDMLADPQYAHDLALAGNWRASIAVPMLQDGEPVGAISVAKAEPEPFSERQIQLLRTFSDQAVIALENARLFQAVKARTEELSEALKQQTATADVLKTISRSTFDLETVLQTLVESAARLCEADRATITRQKEGLFYFSEFYGFSQEFMDYVRPVPVTPERGSGSGRALLDGRIIHIADVKADADYTWTEAQKLGDLRTLLAVPMLREGLPIGVISLTRSAPQPFTEKQIELVSTFADQAAIAIENVRLFDSLQARTRELARSLEELRATQDRLVQTEKLAALGQLTAGVAHEIKNPLNFVNNFADLSSELIEELKVALRAAPFDGRALAEMDEIADTIRGNLEKVVQHGRRADSIVKNMLLHSREDSGERRAIDLNASAEEALNLAYHSARAENPNFQVSLGSDFDAQVGMVEVYPQEFQRVLLNLISNGFYAVRKRQDEPAVAPFQPELRLSTKALPDRIEIRVRDNGIGIPEDVKSKIFNPFFTTKAAGEGTGLGLSLSHDIVVKQHGGTIDAQSMPGEFTEFTITLPRQLRPDAERVHADEVIE